MQRVLLLRHLESKLADAAREVAVGSKTSSMRKMVKHSTGGTADDNKKTDFCLLSDEACFFIDKNQS